MLPVLILLLCVAALLSALLVRERNRRLEAEQASVQLHQAMQNQLQQGLGGMLSVGGAAPASPAIRRADLPPQTVQVNSTSRPAFTISPEAGKRIGFLPGDVILVAEPPATAPSHEKSPG